MYSGGCGRIPRRRPLLQPNCDGIVDDADLLQVLFAFGAQRCNHPADINGDGTVDDADLLQVLLSFGAR